MHPMMVVDDEIALERDGADGMAAERTTPLPFGFGVLVGPRGMAIDPASDEVPAPYRRPEDLSYVNGPRGPRMFLVTFADPSPVPLSPPDEETEDAHVARLAEMYRAGRLHFVGHQANGTEGYMLLSAPNLDEAWDTARRDPLVAAGYYRSVNVTEIEGPYPWHRYGGPGSDGSPS